MGAESRCVTAVLLAALWSMSARASQVPVAVSPGNASQLVLIAEPCPTFSWDPVEQATAHELIVYEVGEEGHETEAVVRRQIPGSASSWTPSLESCLERGGQYAWSVRAVGKKAASAWSNPNLFEVASRPSETEFEVALRVVRDYIGDARAGVSQKESRFASGAALDMTSASSGSRVTEPPAPLALAAGDPALQVNGAAVVTTATLGVGVGSQLCSALDYRWVDLNDGTVLDCNTAKIWLKDATCLGVGTWDASLIPAKGSAQFEIAKLNAGSTSCEDYAAGTYTDWELPAISDLCSAGETLGTCPPGAASESLLDSSVAGTFKLTNAKGDAPWSEGDAFTNVFAGSVWSADEAAATPSLAWFANILNAEVGVLDKGLELLVWPVRRGQ